LSLPFLVGGAIITEKIFAWPGLGLLTIESIESLDAPVIEKIFAWPGLGLLTIESIESLDAPVIMAVVLMFGIAVQVGNLLADIAVAALDPRIRLG
jgi:ABC-type dipeptide/oligopeptide/nickel transport system permease component